MHPFLKKQLKDHLKNSNKKEKHDPQIDEVLAQVLEDLKDMGVYVAVKAVTTSSVYLKFSDPRIRSLTIRDHKTKDKYLYKWNLWIGYDGPNKINDRGVNRFYFSEKQLPAFYSRIRQYHSVILKNSGPIVFIEESDNDNMKSTQWVPQKQTTADPARSIATSGGNFKIKAPE